MISIDVDKQDLVTLVHGVELTREQMLSPLVAKNGSCCGSYDSWSWTGRFKELDEHELYDLYIELKATGFKYD